MARVSSKQNTFGRGVVTQKLHGRQDIELYYSALERCYGYVVTGLGILEKTPGTKLAGRTKDDGEAELVSFIYDDSQAYALEFGDLYMRAWYDGGLVLDGGSPFELVTPYTAAEAIDFSTHQLKDFMWLAHEDHALQSIKRATASTFTIEEFDLRDGPYLDANTAGTTLELADRGAVTPLMTANNAPSGTLSGTTAFSGAWWNAFDGSSSTYVQFNIVNAELIFTFDNGSPSTTRIVDGYWLICGDGLAFTRTPQAWKLQGYDGSDWITIDTQSTQTVWSVGAPRFFSFINETAYEAYKFIFEVNNDSTSNYTIIRQIGLHEKSSEQTPFNMTASSTAGINGGAGFQDPEDVGRLFRLRATDGAWRWGKIATVTSTTVATVTIENHVMPNLDALTIWRLGAFYLGQQPTAVTIHDRRLALGAGNKVFLSQPDDYDNFASTDEDGTVNPDNAITVSIPSTNSKKGSVTKISWLHSLGYQLLVGTPAGMHTIQSTSFGEGIKPDTVTRRPQDSRGAAKLEPIMIGDSVIYSHKNRRKVMGSYYRQGTYDQIGAQNLSNPADQLTKGYIKGLVWQEEPHSIGYMWTSSGDLAALTVQPEEKVQGWAIEPMGGKFIDGGMIKSARVDSMCVVPNDGAINDEVYMIVKRTIDGSTVRSVEVQQPYWEPGDDVLDAWFLDGALKYEGNADPAKTITFTGTGTDPRSATANFTSPALTEGETLMFHDGVRWHHGTMSSVASGGGSQTFTWTPTLPNAGPGPADGRWHYDSDLADYVQRSEGDAIDVHAYSYVEPANQTAIARWSQRVTSISGLDDWEGDEIDLMVDGWPVYGVTVASGAVTGISGHIVLAGFSRPSGGKLLSIEAGSQSGSAQGKQRPVYETVIDVLDTIGLEAGTGMPSSYDGVWEQFAPAEPADHDINIPAMPPVPFTGLIRSARDEQHSVDMPAVAWRQKDPWPSIIRGIITRLSTSDGR